MRHVLYQWNHRESKGSSLFTPVYLPACYYDHNTQCSEYQFHGSFPGYMSHVSCNGMGSAIYKFACRCRSDIAFEASSTCSADRNSSKRKNYNRQWRSNNMDGYLRRTKTQSFKREITFKGIYGRGICISCGLYQKF